MTDNGPWHKLAGLRPVELKSCDHAIGMLNAGMTMNAVAMNSGCSALTIRHIRQRFQATRRAEDRSRSGCPCVTTRGQDRYIRNTHLRNRSQTATATAAYTHGTHKNRTSAQTVRNRLREGGLSANRPYLVCVSVRRHRVIRVNWARTHQSWLRQQCNNVLFSDKSRFTIHRMNVMPLFRTWTRSFWGVRVLSWSGRAWLSY